MAWGPFAFAYYTVSGDAGLFGRTLSAYVVGVGCLIVGLYSFSEPWIFFWGARRTWGR